MTAVTRVKSSRRSPDVIPTDVWISDPRREYLSLETELKEAVVGVLASGTYVQGGEVAELEKAFAAFCRVEHAIATCSGTAAILVGLRALGIGPDDDVLMPVYGCLSTASAILHAGAGVQFADVEEETLTIDVAQVEKAITPRTRAVIPIHVHGQLADMDGLRAIAGRHGLAILEDAALVVGGCLQSRPVGGLGDVGAFSFAPGKVLSGLGWGGMVTVRDAAVADRARQLAGHGPSAGRRESGEKLVGFNVQMSGLVAASLRVKLPYVEGWARRRREIARRYDAVCDQIELARLRPRAGSVPSYRTYVVRHRFPDELIERLCQVGVHAASHYVPPLHLRPVLADLGYRRGDFPAAERAADELVCLPVHAQLSDDEVERIIGVLREAV